MKEDIKDFLEALPDLAWLVVALFILGVAFAVTRETQLIEPIKALVIALGALGVNKGIRKPNISPIQSDSTLTIKE